jgi:sugar O-acyltransferase (sialic acid O-acetyltransferase NeuD family)
MAERKKVVIIGAGGFAREVLDIFDACNDAGDHYVVLGYVVESPFGAPGAIVNEKPILGGLEWLDRHHRDVFVICGVGAPELRRRLVLETAKRGARFCSVLHPSVQMSRRNSIGSGVIIAAGCILTNQIQIGDHVQINLDCTIGHDAIISDFVTVSPGTHISGNVTIRTGCNIGTGVNIINRLEIGEWSVIGAGSTIIRNVPPNTTVVGVPGKVVTQREDGWHLIS